MRTFVWIGIILGAFGALALLEPSHSCAVHRPFSTIALTRTPCWYHQRLFAPLKTIASAQADYRGNDRDGNGVQDFWREDISGLYSALPAGSMEMIKLIEISVAGADPTPKGKHDLSATGPGQVALDHFAVPAPMARYYYQALRHADEQLGALDPNRFAACAYPADYPLSSHWTFIISEGNTIFKRDLGRPGPPDVFPDESTLKREWSKVD